METNMNNSEGLNKFFEKSIDQNIEQKLVDLEVLGIDKELFDEFKNRIDRILNENPEARDIVGVELEKTKIALEHTLEHHRKRVRGIIKNASEDNLSNLDNEI